jgi:hypothetical protein
MDVLLVVLAIPAGLALTWLTAFCAAHGALAAWRRQRAAQTRAEEELADERAEARLSRARG